LLAGGDTSQGDKLLNEKDITNNTKGISDFCWLVGTLAREIAVVGVPTDHDGRNKAKI